MVYSSDAFGNGGIPKALEPAQFIKEDFDVMMVHRQKFFSI